MVGLGWLAMSFACAPKTSGGGVKNPPASDDGGSGGQAGSNQTTTGAGGSQVGSGTGGNNKPGADASGAGGTIGNDAGSAGVGGNAVGTTDPVGQPTLPSGRGAIMPFTEYEAEAATLTGATVLGPTRTVNSLDDIAAEASGRKAVRLGATGNYLEFKNLNPSNSIVVRYSIPDGAPDTTVSLYVDGKFRQKLKVTARYSWSYGGADDFANTGIQNNPGSGNPHHFFDETHALTGDLAVGAMVRLQKDADDTAAHYDIDFIDMEQVPPALGKPDGSLSLTDCGATPNDGIDDTAAMQTCVTRTRNLYIPEGVFDIKTKEISVPGITIRGAGMWRSVLNGFFARLDCYAKGCKFYDFAVNGDTTQRDDSSPETGFTGNGMSGAVIEHIWVEHKKLGVWPGSNTTGLTIRNSRFRDLFADGINFPCGTTNSLVEHTQVRNSGDDSFAVWSQNTCGQATSNIIRHVYAQLPWRANCFGLYGGSTTLQDSVCADAVQYPGLLIGRMFDANAFTTTTISGITLTRAGGPMYAQQGALKVNAEQGPVQNVQISNVDIDSPTFSGVHLAGGNTIDTLSFTGVSITNPGACGILAQSTGAANASNVVVTGTGSGLCNEKGFSFIKGAGDTGW
ncbi:MAG TPA: hypothetical protein VH374_02025 [Polyangia bacterium]|nr:hypothetical protein [Polyangia bacterium]